jgi:ligand-binding SRPBCC domain-containing protein
VLGERVTWKAKHFGIWFKFHVIISEYNPNDHFEDKMTKGPFKYFIHSHEFLMEEETVLMKDHIRFQSPVGFIGRWVDKIFMKDYLIDLLKRRNDYIKRTAETGSADEYV